MPSSFSHLSPDPSTSSVCGTYESPTSNRFTLLDDPHGLIGSAESSGYGTTHSPLAANDPRSHAGFSPVGEYEAQHSAMDEGVKGKSRVGGAASTSDPVAERPAWKKPTSPPTDVLRRGEDLGLSLGDFDMLDTLG